MGKYKGRVGSLTFVWQPDWEKESFEFKPVDMEVILVFDNLDE